MGMFDHIRCAYPLPEHAPVDGYQTKDTDAQLLRAYTITADGRLLDERGEAVPYHGALTFYTDNLSAVCSEGYITYDHRRAEFWEFTARFDRGRLVTLDGGQQRPSDFFDCDPMTPDEFSACLDAAASMPRRRPIERWWQYQCPDGEYVNTSLAGLLWDILAHRWWHFRRGDGWRD